MENNRAKQFMPFDALKGYREALRAKERIIVKKKAVSEEDLERFSYLLNNARKGMMAHVEHFDKEEYIQTEGLLSEVNVYERFIKVVKTKIPFDTITSLLIDELEQKNIE